MSRKRFYKPMEVETMLQEKREVEGLTGDTEFKTIKATIETAKRNRRVGDKILIVVPPSYIHVPDWQRKLDISKAQKIGFNYNKYKWEVPKVIYCDGKLIVADGMHRLIGGFLGGIDGVVVEILEISEQEAIKLFLEQGTDRLHMKPHDYFNASVKAEKPEYVAFRDICREFHVQIKGEDYEKNPIGTFTSLSDGINMCKANPNTLKKIIKLISELQWNQVGSDEGKAFSAKYVRVMKKLYAYYAEHEAEMESILKSKCAGANWFERNAMELAQKNLFDSLSNIIHVGLTTERPKLMPIKSA